VLQVFHTEHFSCAGCGSELAGKPLKEWEDDPYCVACYKERERHISTGAAAFPC
jgi:hypothetical protein